MSAIEDSKLNEVLGDTSQNGEKPDIDLDKLVDCSFNYSFDPLKKALAYLLKTQDQAGTLKRVQALETLCKDYQKEIAELKEDRDNMQIQLEEHEERIEKLENGSGGNSANKSSSSDLSDKIKELEYEIKLLAERIRELQMLLNDLVKQKGELGEETEENAQAFKVIESTRKQLEGDCNGLKNRMGLLEDRLKMLQMKRQEASKDSILQTTLNTNESVEVKLHPDDERTKNMETDLDTHKSKIKELEEMIRALQRDSAFQAANSGDGTDYMVIIEELRDDLEGQISGIKGKLDKVSDSQAKTDFRSQNNETRIDALEGASKEHGDKIVFLMKNQKNALDDLEKKVKELKDQVNEKVDSDTFDSEISCKQVYHYIP